MTEKATPASMDGIVALARDYARARDALEDTAEEIRDLQRKAIRSRIRGLRGRVADAAAAHDALRAAIGARPDLFVRPRTVAVDGVKFGWRKQAGALDIGDEAQAIARLRKLFPDREAATVNVRESLDKKALRKMPGGELARLGVAIADPVDEIVIAVAESDVDRLVAALIDDADPAGIEAEAA
ncbi:MAG: hypothetical protein OXC28_07300 [Defluviicoccus sp.]|nr:hypothetical protein [Defluviicoccus sp.]